MEIRYLLLFAFFYHPTTNKLADAKCFTGSLKSRMKACAVLTYCIRTVPINYISQLVDCCEDTPAACPVTPAQLAEVKQIHGSDLPTEEPATKRPVDEQKGDL